MNFRVRPTCRSWRIHCFPGWKYGDSYDTPLPNRWGGGLIGLQPPAVNWTVGYYYHYVINDILLLIHPQFPLVPFMPPCRRGQECEGFPGVSAQSRMGGIHRHRNRSDPRRAAILRKCGFCLSVLLKGFGSFPILLFRKKSVVYVLSKNAFEYNVRYFHFHFYLILLGDSLFFSLWYIS